MRDGELALPLPRGWRFLLRAQVEGDGVRITDGGGGERFVGMGVAVNFVVADAVVEVVVVPRPASPGRGWTLWAMVAVAAGAVALGVRVWRPGETVAPNDPMVVRQDPDDGDKAELARVQALARDRLRADPDDLPALEVLSFTQYLDGDDAGASATVQRMLDLAPEHAVAWNNRGLIAKRRGDYLGEEADYRRALELRPADPTFLNNLALCLAHQGRFEEADAMMAALAPGAPGDPYIDLHRAKIAMLRRDDLAAYRWLDQAVAGVAGLDRLHDIEFRQDIVLEPAFDRLRTEERFVALQQQAARSRGATAAGR